MKLLLPPWSWLCFHLCPFVGLFVSGITQKNVLNVFPQNLDGGWLSDQNKLLSLLGWIWVGGRGGGGGGGQGA